MKQFLLPIHSRPAAATMGRVLAQTPSPHVFVGDEADGKPDATISR